MKMNTKKGFTLIELLIVIAIIGVLAVAFLPSLLGAPAKGRDTSRIADLQKIQKVLINANLEGIVYPSATSVPVFPSGCIDPAAPFANAAKYLSAFGGKTPVDPVETNTVKVEELPLGCQGKYFYTANPSAANSFAFGLYAKMETEAAGNVSCATILADSASLAAPPANDADSCYAILTQ